MSLRMHDVRGWGDDEGSDGGLGGGGGSGGGGGCDPTLYHACREVAQAVRDADELLRGLAVYPNRFAFVGVNANLTPDLVKLMYEGVWFHVHGLVHAVLQNPTQSDPEAILTCLDVVQSMLCAAMFLGLRPQRQSFAGLLSKFKMEQERMAFGFGSGAAATATGGGSGSGGEGRLAVAGASAVSGNSISSGTMNGNGRLECTSRNGINRTGSSSKGDGAWNAIGQVHALVTDLKDSVQQSRLREELKAVAKRIEARAKLLEGNRRFLREGDLVKKCRSGKRKVYTFFLFSDQLLYTHRGFGGEYKVHAFLLLSLTKVSNVEDRRNCSFQIHHPQKSFTVVAESPEMKRVWMRDINEARNLCRKSVVETQLSVIASLKVESARLMAVLQGETTSMPGGGDYEGGMPNVMSAPPSFRQIASSNASASPYSFDDQLKQHRHCPMSTTMVGGRSRGGGNTLSASPSNVSETPSSLRLQDVELEAQFCDGLRVLHNLLRKSATILTSTTNSPRLFPTPRSPVHHVVGEGVGGAEEAEWGASMVDDETLASAVGLFLQYQEGDYSHRDHPPNLAFVLGGGRGPGGEEENRRSSSRLSCIMALAQEAWKANAGLSQTAAMTKFLVALETVIPGWRDGALTIQFPGFGGGEPVGGRGGGGSMA